MKRLPILLSFAAGMILLPALALAYLAFGRPSVAATDGPFPFEAQIVGLPLAARIHREMPAQSPIPASDENLVAGAGIYEDKCEVCHGTQIDPSGIGKSMFPHAPQ